MCLITKRTKHFVASKDFTCYKILKYITSNSAASFYWNNGFLYNLGTLYETTLCESSTWTVIDSIDSKDLQDLYPGILSIFRNYNNKDYSLSEEERELKRGLISIGKGFHSSRTIERLIPMLDDTRRLTQQLNIYKCTIPKGSFCYENSNNLLVSNKIIINSN